MIATVKEIFNQSMFAKVISKIKVARFLWLTVYCSAGSAVCLFLIAIPSTKELQKQCIQLYLAEKEHIERAHPISMQSKHISSPLYRLIPEAAIQTVDEFLSVINSTFNSLQQQ